MVQVKKLETRPRRCRGRAWTWANTLRIIFYNVRGDGPHVEGGKVLRTNAHAGGKLFGLIGYLLLLLGMISWMIGAEGIHMNIYETIQGRVLTHCLYITPSSNTITHTIHLGACSWGHFEYVVIRLLIVSAVESLC